MREKFLIISNVRCGATWLQGLLSSFEDIHCDDEYRWNLGEDASYPHVIDLAKPGPSLEELLERKTAPQRIQGSKLLMLPLFYPEEVYQDLRRQDCQGLENHLCAEEL